MKTKKDHPFVVTQEDREASVGEEVLNISEKINIVSVYEIAKEVFGLTDEEVEESIRQRKLEQELHKTG